MIKINKLILIIACVLIGLITITGAQAATVGPYTIGDDETIIFYDDAETGTPSGNNWSGPVDYFTNTTINETIDNKSIAINGANSQNYANMGNITNESFPVYIRWHMRDDLSENFFTSTFTVDNGSFSNFSAIRIDWSDTEDYCLYLREDGNSSTLVGCAGVNRSSGYHDMRLEYTNETYLKYYFNDSLVYSGYSPNIFTPNTRLTLWADANVRLKNTFDEILVTTTTGNVSCTPDWSCSGYETPTCLINDTSTAACNAVTDNNACGENYTGDYSEFANQTGVCDYCTPSWSCGGYGACQPDDYQYCNLANDSNSCYATTGLPADQYGGNYSEFSPLACDYCTPSWSCSGYEECRIDDLQSCDTVTDNNACNESYTGNYSEFSDQACDYCTPSWSCSAYGSCINSSQNCTAVDDNNSCYATTNLTSDEYGGNYSEFTQACEETTSEKMGTAFNTLLSMIPLLVTLMLISGALLFSGIGSNDKIRMVLGGAITLVILLVLIAIL